MRRVLLVALGVAVAAAGLVAVSLALSSRDDSQVSAAEGPGELQPDHGARHDAAAQVPAGELPTSGTHEPDLVTRDRRELTDDQIIHALELGNVVVLYSGAQPGAALVRLQEDVAGPFDAELAAAGQAVILARRSGAGPATALAWRRLLKVDDASDPQLRDFAESWLGRGIP